MASPIFISNASPSLSPLLIIRGFQLAILGIYRGLQNPKLYLFEGNAKYITLVLKDTFLMQCIVIIPILALYLAICIVSLYTGREYNTLFSSISYVHYNVININFLLMNLVIALRSNGSYNEWYFSKSLEWFNDDFFKSFDAIRKYNKDHSDPTLGNLCDYSRIYKSNRYMEKFKNTRLIMAANSSNAMSRCLRLVGLNCLLYLCASHSKLVTNTVTSILLFKNLSQIFGSTIALFIILFSLQLPYTYIITFIIVINETRFLMNELVIDPFFDTMIQFTKSEKRQWIKSREGVIFGFAFAFTLMIRQYPELSLFILAISKISLGYLLTKICENPPKKSSSLIRWIPGQLFWSKEQERHISNGNFVNDTGYISFPGSYLL